MATANVLSYAEIFQSALDKQMVQEITSGWMEANASQVRYNGGNTVQIPKITTEGLGAYSKSGGFPDGAVTLEWETRSLTQDRGKEFNIDAQDVDETNFVLQAPMVMGEFQRTKVAPEIDAYRYSKIFNLSNQKLKTTAYTPAVGDIYAKIKADITAVQDVVGETEPLVIMISYAASDVLDNSDDIEKSLPLVDFAAGGINTKVKSIDGIPMIRVPSARFKSEYTFSATNGFAPTANAMVINWIVAARSALIAVVKTDKVRMFSPDQNQDMDAWKIQYRKYHEIWIKDNGFDGINVSYTAISAPTLTATIAAGTGAGNTKATITVGTGNTLGYTITAAAVTANYNDVPTGLTAYTSAASVAITAGKYWNLYELDSTGHVVKFVSHLMVSGEIA